MFCSKCGNSISSGSGFCGNCYTPVAAVANMTGVQSPARPVHQAQYPQAQTQRPQYQMQSGMGYVQQAQHPQYQAQYTQAQAQRPQYQMQSGMGYVQQAQHSQYQTQYTQAQAQYGQLQPQAQPAGPANGMGYANARPANIKRRYGKLNAFGFMISTFYIVVFLLCIPAFLSAGAGPQAVLAPLLIAALFGGIIYLICRNVVKITPAGEEKRTLFNMWRFGFMVWFNVSWKIATFTAFFLVWFMPWLADLGFKLDEKFKSDYTLFDAGSIRRVTKIVDNLFSDDMGTMYYAVD